MFLFLTKEIVMKRFILVSVLALFAVGCGCECADAAYVGYGAPVRSFVANGVARRQARRDARRSHGGLFCGRFCR